MARFSSLMNIKLEALIYKKKMNELREEKEQ
jgi:hypothetical protein